MMGPPSFQKNVTTSLNLGLMNMGIGKLSQHSNQSKTEFVQNQYRITELFTDPSLEIPSAMLINPNTLEVKYKTKETNLKVNLKAQTCIGAAVTALARIHLDRSLRTLQDRGCQLIYCDTGEFFIIEILKSLVCSPKSPKRFFVPTFFSN